MALVSKPLTRLGKSRGKQTQTMLIIEQCYVISVKGFVFDQVERCQDLSCRLLSKIPMIFFRKEMNICGS